MTETLISLGLAAFVAVCFWLSHRSPPVRFAPYRRVTQRHIETDGTEVVTLACGHQYRLIHHEQRSFPCEHCQEREK